MALPESNKLPAIAKALTWLLGILSVLAIGHWFYLGGRRFFYPYEMLWMEGSMLEQVLRILHGKGLYVAPSVNYVPWLYQPVYYYATAVITWVSGLTFPAARILSVASTIGTGATIACVVYRETGKSKFWSLVGAGLFFISYGKVGYCFEVARVDSLFLFLLVAGSVVMVYAKSVWMVIFGAVLLALSYFTKQSAMVFLPGLLLLLYFRNKKNGVIFLISIVVLVIGGTLLLNSATSGWYGYYTLDIPSAKRKTFRWDEGVTEFFGYVILRCWAITIGVLIYSLRDSWRKNFATFLRSNDALFAMLLLSALATAFLGLGNEGGGKNVLLPLAAYSAILLPIAVAGRIKTSTKAKHQVIWLSLTAIQFFALISDPYLHPRNIPTKADIRNQEVFIDSLRGISGEVWVPYHSFMPHMAGKETFAELRAYGDVLLMEDSTAHRLKHDLDSALAAHKFSSIYDDMPDTIPGYRLLYGAINLHKAQALADTLIYVYLPK